MTEELLVLRREHERLRDELRVVISQVCLRTYIVHACSSFEAALVRLVQRDEVRASYELRFKSLSEELNVTRLKLADSERLAATLRIEITQSSERASRSLAEVLLKLLRCPALY